MSSHGLVAHAMDYRTGMPRKMRQRADESIGAFSDRIGRAQSNLRIARDHEAKGDPAEWILERLAIATDCITGSSWVMA